MDARVIHREWKKSTDEEPLSFNDTSHYSLEQGRADPQERFPQRRRGDEKSAPFLLSDVLHRTLSKSMKYLSF
jgi:hypothetical protein